MKQTIAEMTFDLAHEERAKRLIELRSELFDLANSFAGDETGDTAVMLHGGCNQILWALQRIETD